MPFTEEQEKMILDAITSMNNKEAAAKEEQKQEPKQETLNDQAKKKAEEENTTAAIETRLEGAIKFCSGVESFVKDNSIALPENCANIVALAREKKYSSAVERANDVRKSIIDEYLTEQKNLDILTPSMKEKVNKYKGLTEDAKKEKSSSFWDIVEVGTALISSASRASEVNTANNSSNSSFTKRFLALGDRK